MVVHRFYAEAKGSSCDKNRNFTKVAKKSGTFSGFKRKRCLL